MLVEQMALVQAQAQRMHPFPRMSLYYLFIYLSEMSYSAVPLSSLPAAAMGNLQSEQCHARKAMQGLSSVLSLDLWLPSLS